MYIFKQLIINSIKSRNWIAATTKTKEDIAAWQQHNRYQQAEERKTVSLMTG